MGRAFNRLEKQVAGRRAGVNRVVSWQTRIHMVEVTLFEIATYVASIAVDKDSKEDSRLIESLTEFKAHLEGVLK